MPDTIQKFSAPVIFTGKGEVLRNKVLVFDSSGVLQTIDIVENHDPASILFLEGALSPGHINTHCHLELSHMKGKVATGTHLLPFLKAVVNFRDIDPDVISEAIVNADLEMQANGIVAVGDISNKADTAEVKQNSPIRYYTFVEMFDFLQDGLAASTFQKYMEVFNEHNGHKSIAPHAPYTVSKSLFSLINGQNVADTTISIHNQETPHENELFLKGSGGFFDFFSQFGMDMTKFQATGKSAIHYALEHLRTDTRTIMVHNTQSVTEDILAATKANPNTYWASCPNANLYIENQLPDYQQWINAGATITLGTDSLTSNWQLSIAEEMFTISRYCSFIPLEDLVTWATWNGARALGFDSDLGSLEPGKSPGLVQMDVTETSDRLMMRSPSCKKIV